jgi:hypothetical protein
VHREMKAVLALSLFIQMAVMSSSSAQPPKVIGSWKVEIVFANGETHSVRFDAQASGKGSLALLIPKPISVGPAEGPAAKWSESDNGSMIFSGPVQFPLGNVGLLRGTLVLRGQFQPEGSITGEATFFPMDQETKDTEAKPSKRGTFKATRVAD